MISFIVALSFFSAVFAFPNGAPICSIGPGVLRNEHVRDSRNPQTGSVEKENYVVLLNGNQIYDDPLDETLFNLFQFGEVSTLTLQSPPVGSYFKGLLVIASAGNVDNVDILDTKTPGAIIITDPNTTKPSLGCENVLVSSATHVINTEKSSVAMGFQWAILDQKLFLDVNIVVNNNVTAGSQYYYTQYPMLSFFVCEPRPCGLFGLQMFCPSMLCGLFGRLLGLCDPYSGC